VGETGFRDHGGHPRDECLGVELGADNLVGAVGEQGDAPVADEGDELAGMDGLDLGAEALGVGHGGFAFDVDEDEVGCLLVEERETFVDVACGFDDEAGEAQDLVTNGPEDLALTDVKDGFRSWSFGRHGVPGEAFEATQAFSHAAWSRDAMQVDEG